MTTDQTQMASLLRFLQGAYPNLEVRPETIASWMCVLGHLDYAIVFRAVHDIASRKGGFAPTPGDVAERVRTYKPAVGASDVSLIGPPEGEDRSWDEHCRLMAAALRPPNQ